MGATKLDIGTYVGHEITKTAYARTVISNPTKTLLPVLNISPIVDSLDEGEGSISYSLSPIY